MKYIKATEEDLEHIVMLVQETIKTIYPKYYPKEIVDFFCRLHCGDGSNNVRISTPIFEKPCI